MPRKTSMDGALESIFVLRAWLVVFVVIGILGNWKLAKGDNNPGFISIDCGADSDYVDESTGIFYKSDTSFIDTGANNDISPEYYYSNPVYARQANTLRSFPQGTKNCYTLKPKQQLSHRGFLSIWKLRQQESNSEIQRIHWGKLRIQWN
ncbi:probable LRR receptor-like serine/threonine-protein kinase At4g29180 [Quercus robur]|uniref:probable LRR receptor-like serine/threonine-protein kinase At4g29180 n=1 Tax=Quercus robur TaxID=38942 RepID=UPI0021633DEB|nr:probable LRR receptor-like serine/threonine-protein kinase At4g29180 [Quercus robur]